MLILDAAGVSHPCLEGSLRGVAEVRALRRRARGGPWLMGERLTPAGLLLASPFLWFDGLDAGSEAARDRVARAADRPGLLEAGALDARLMGGLAGELAA